MFSIIASQNHSRTVPKYLLYVFVRRDVDDVTSLSTEYIIISSIFLSFLFRRGRSSSFESERGSERFTREPWKKYFFESWANRYVFRWKLASKQKSRERREFRPALKDSVDSTSPKKINSGSQPDGKSQFSPLSRTVDLNRIIRRCVVTLVSLSFPLTVFLSFFFCDGRAGKKKWKRARRLAASRRGHCHEWK